MKIRIEIDVTRDQLVALVKQSVIEKPTRAAFARWAGFYLIEFTRDAEQRMSERDGRES